MRCFLWRAKRAASAGGVAGRCSPLLLAGLILVAAAPAQAGRLGWNKKATPTPSAESTPAGPWLPDPPFVDGTPSGSATPSFEARTFAAFKPVLASVTAVRSQDKGGTSQGSAFVIHASGLLLTNYHVVRDSDELRVRFSDGEAIEARLAGSDPALDLAVLRIDPPAKLGSAMLGNSDRAREGDPVVALGMPYGLGATITRGILSGKDRRVDVGAVGAAGSPVAFLQTDAAINPGSSGGPIVDADGLVIGVTTATIPAAKGISFAIPINAAKLAIPRMLREAGIGHAWLGLTLGPANGSGAEVVGLRHGGPADKAGLQTGDTVTAIRDKSISSDQDLAEAVKDISVHETVRLTYARHGKVTRVDITAGEVPVAPIIESLLLGGALMSEFNADSPETVRAGRRFGTGPGVFFDSVPKGSGAEKAGVQEGDVLMVIGMDNVSDLDDVRVLLDREDTNSFKVLIRRGTRTFTAIVPR